MAAELPGERLEQGGGIVHDRLGIVQETQDRLQAVGFPLPLANAHPFHGAEIAAQLGGDVGEVLLHDADLLAILAPLVDAECQQDASDDEQFQPIASRAVQAVNGTASVPAGIDATLP